MRLHVYPLGAAAIGLLFAACGGSVADNNTQPAPSTTSSGTDDAGTPPDTGTVGDDSGAPEDTGTTTADAGSPDTTTPTDHGEVSTTYPAFTPDMPSLANNGGMILDAAIVVTVTFPGEVDADATHYESFADNLGTSDYWKQIVSEYGVGPTTSGAANHVRMTTAPPASMTTDDVATFVQTNAGSPATSGWPAPGDETIYTLYLPSTTILDMGGGNSACDVGVGGYHDSVEVAGRQVAYAVIPHCDFSNGTEPIADQLTVDASHEIAEAATDPHPQVGPGVVGSDDNHVVWDLWMAGNSEVGDMCEIYRDAEVKLIESDALTGYVVQRQWSSLSAKAGHNPCVPLPSGPYFNVVPLAQEDVTIDLSGPQYGLSNHFKTKGYHVAVGETKTFQVGFYSDSAIANPWTIAVKEGNAPGLGFGGTKTSHLTVTVDKTTGLNGEKANVTVNVTAAGKTKSETIYVTSSDASGMRRYMPILIGSE